MKSRSISFAATIVTCLFAIAAGSSPAATFYVALDGRVDNDGSEHHPWPSVAHALGAVGGGHTVVVKPGTYAGPIVISRAHAGTAERPTVVRSETKWKAVVIGSPEHAMSNGDGCHWCVIDGFEIVGARLDGIKMNGSHNVVRNCWVHNNGGMGIAMHEQQDGTLENNLVEFNGCHVQLHHGIYASGDRLTLRGNIMRHNACYGLHLYPAIKNSVVQGNLVYGHARRAGVLLACPADGGNNVVVNNTIADNAGAIEVWNGKGETIVNNILVAKSEPLWYDSHTRDIRADYNLCLPASAHGGSHGLTGDPLFVDAQRGAYWLRPESPAIGKGSRPDAPKTDFWGRLYDDRAVDIGCFPFVARLLEPRARADWHLGYAYRFSLADAQDMPDLWALPR